MTGSLWYTEAIHHQFAEHQTSTTGTPNKGVLHSTETTSLPGYENGAVAPHLTLAPDFHGRKFTYYQHFPFTSYSRSLENRSGGIETNKDHVVQIEIVGTCDPDTHNKWQNLDRDHLYMPELPRWALYDLGKLVEWFNHEYGIPLVTTPFEAYPKSYGQFNGVRMKSEQWSKFSGWCGHQHVPENHHGDPGAIRILDIMSYAYALKEDRNMPSSAEIAAAVVNASIVNNNVDVPATKTTVGQVLSDIEVTQDKHGKRLAAIEATQTDTLLQLNAILAAVQSNNKEGK